MSDGPGDLVIIVYTVDTLRSASREELVAQIDALIKHAATYTTAGADRALSMFRAQLPMNELMRRDQNAQTNAMLRYTRRVTSMTLVIAFMTAIQLVLALPILPPVALWVRDHLATFWSGAR
jgi:hypothetical protein